MDMRGGNQETPIWIWGDTKGGWVVSQQDEKNKSKNARVKRETHVCLRQSAAVRMDIPQIPDCGLPVHLCSGSFPFWR